MKLICCALLLIALGAQAYPHNNLGHLAHPYNYGYHQQGYHGYYPYNIPINYRYNGGLNHHHNHHGHQRCPGNTQTCPDGYTFNRRLCGCFKDGDELPEATGGTPIKVKVPVPVPVPIPAVRPPPCQRIFPCTVGQVFDESRCQCVCAVQITQCPGRTTYNPSQCKCECTTADQRTCLPFQRFNTLLCVCEPSSPPTIPLPPAPLPPVVVFPPAPAPPGPLPPLPPTGPVCPPSSQFRCNSFQVLNPSTCNCECSPLAASRCRFPQSLNPTTCQCECSGRTAASCNSQLQRFNFDNCECECINVFVTVQRTIPGAPVRGPSIPGPFLPGPFIPAPPAPFPPFIPSRTGTPGSRSKRRAKKREARNGEVLGPDGEFKVRGVMKRRTGPTGPGTGPGFIFPPVLPPVRGPPVRGPSIPGPFVPGPSTTVTERRLVSAPCPAGTIVNSRSCECL